MTREEYNDISAALDRIMKRVADDETLPQKAAIGAVGVLGGFQLFIKEYYEKHSTATPQGLDEAPKRRLRKVSTWIEDAKYEREHADEILEKGLEELRQIRAEKDRLDEAAEQLSVEYRKRREKCGLKDPIALNEVEEANYLGVLAGAKWMAEQGTTLELEVKEDGGGYPYIPGIEFYDYDKDKPTRKVGDKVIVQIRKKDE